MKQIDKIIKSQSEPKDINVLWLDTSNPEEPILKEYDGGWKTVAGGGGGGDATDAIKYTEQELTAPQQMQARKNQGLYYEEEGIREITTPLFDSQEVLDDAVGGLFKVNNDTPSKEELSGLIFGGSAPSPISSEDIHEYDFGYIIGGSSFSYFYVVLTEYSYSSYTYDAGIYILASTYPNLKQQLVYNGTATTIHHIEPKYIKDMYYEESGTGEKTVESVATESPTPAFFYDYIGFYKASSDTPSIADIKKVNNNTIGDGDLTAEDEGDYTIYTPSGATETQGKFIVVYENTTIDSHDAEPGLYYPSDGIIFARPYLTSVTYIGDISIVHQIPNKYIPSVGAPAVKMTIPSMGDDVYYNMGILNVNQYVPSRDIVFSVEGRTVVYAYAFDVINGGTNGQEGDTLTFSSGGLYWVQLELDYEYGLPAYMCAMVYVESDNQ